MHLALIGFRCCGKTTTGEILARSLDLPFTDTDRLVEEISGMPIHRMVSLKGWPEFRKVEAEALETALAMDRRVIATGGGIVLSPENVSKLRKRAKVFWLCASADLVRDRMNEDGGNELRPALSRDDAVEEIPAILEQRNPLYRSAADHIVNTGLATPEQAAMHICSLLESEPVKERYS